MELDNAEVAVTTQHLIDIHDDTSHWFQLSDFCDMGEFLCSCSDLFPDEEDPQYRYPRWENIPDRLINREWLCPNFFEIRDALEKLEEGDREFFFTTWSEHYGYDITTDDPHMMVSHFQDLCGNIITESDDELAEIAEESLLYTGISSNYCDRVTSPHEVFDDNYD